MKLPETLFRSALLVTWFFALNLAAASTAADFEKPHVIIETDLGGDPDDEASMVRFLLYACDFEIDGIILTNEKTRHGISGAELFERYLAAYSEVLPSLREHRADYPSAERLRDVARTAYGSKEEKDPAGARFLIEVADKKLPHRTWYLNWGCDSSMRLALDLVNAERGVEGLTEFCRRFHNSSLSHGCPPNSTRQHFARNEMRQAHKESGMVVVNHSDGGGKPFVKWYHQMGPITTAAGTSVKEDITTGHGPLGELYTTQKEGDTATFLHLIPNGLSDPLRPDQGNWAGRYGRVDSKDHVSDTLCYWPNQMDTWKGEKSWHNTRSRWGDATQGDFLCRLDWCVKGFAEANHPPQVILNGDKSLSVLEVVGSPGSVVKPDASGSSDPDQGDTLRYEWIHHRDAGTFQGEVTLKNADAATCEIEVPASAKPGETIQVIVQVTDNGGRKDNGIRDLTRYRRLVLTIQE